MPIVHTARRIICASPPRRERKIMSTTRGGTLSWDRTLKTSNTKHSWRRWQKSHLALAIRTKLARVQETPPLAMASGQLQTRVQYAPPLARKLETLRARVQRLPPTVPPSAARQGREPAHSRSPCAAGSPPAVADPEPEPVASPGEVASVPVGGGAPRGPLPLWRSSSVTVALRPAPPCWHCGGAVQREPLRRSTAHAAVAPCGVGKSPRRAHRGHHPWRPLETNAIGHPTAVSDLECSCSGGGGGSGDKWKRRVCPGSFLHAANLVAEHLGASSRSPRHPFPALMAEVKSGRVPVYTVTNVFVDERQWMHLIMGAVSLWTRPPALYLCLWCRALKIPTHRVRVLQLRDLRNFLRSEPPGICPCTQRACNNIVEARIRRAATVGSRQTSHNLHPRDLLDLQTGTSNTLSMNCNWEKPWSAEQPGPWESASAPRQEICTTCTKGGIDHATGESLWSQAHCPEHIRHLSLHNDGRSKRDCRHSKGTRRESTITSNTSHARTTEYSPSSP